MMHSISLMNRVAAVLCGCLLMNQPIAAGGPLTVGGTGAGVPGVPLVWDDTKPVLFRVDTGPLSGTVNNATGVSRVQAMFSSWSAVPSADLTITNAGPLLAAGTFAGGDVVTVQDFLNVVGDPRVQATPDPNSCNGGGQSPIVFDVDGSIFNALGLPPEVIGFAFQCAFNPTTGKVSSAGAILNGKFQDGINNPSAGNYELTTNEFNQAFTHEFGHFLGLGHSQINVDLFLEAVNSQTYSCTTDDTAGMPLMFPVLGVCPAKVTAGVPIIAVDDAAWISKLYPVGASPPSGKKSYTSSYGTVTGSVFFSDGTTPAQGVNIVVRSTSSPRRNAVSAVSGDLFTGNPGQTSTCVDPSNPTQATCSNLGDPSGARDPNLIGHFEIPLSPGTYTVSVESVYAGFTSGSSLTPLDPPIPAPGSYVSASPVSVTAGGATTLNITLQGTGPRFDAFESAFEQRPQPPVRWLRRNQLQRNALGS